MRIPEHPTLIRRLLDSRLQQLVPKQPVLAASLLCCERRCGKPSCRCMNGGPKHRSHQVSYKVNNRTRTVYVPKDLVPEVTQWIDQHRQLKKLLKEIQLLTLALIRTHAQHHKRKKGRS
jgi:hypothetical protein